MAPIDPEDLSGEGCLSVYPLRTERLLLRPVGPEHVDAIAAQANDEAVVRYTARLPFPYERKHAETYVAEAQALHEAGRGPSLAIERRGDGLLYGVIALDRSGSDADGAELGYWLGREHWGQGIATEAARALLDHAFQDLGLARVTARVATENGDSRQVLVKLGFTSTGPAPCEAPARVQRVLPAETFVLTAEAFRAASARPTVLVSAVALLDPDNRVLLARRPQGKAMAGLWEFPGGKVDPGETPERALMRELHEELGIDVRESCLAPLTFASHSYPNFHLLMPLYVCRQWKGRVTGREGQELAWVRPERLRDYEMPPADVPLVAILQDWL